MASWMGVLCLALAINYGHSSWEIQRETDLGYTKILVAIHSSVPEDTNLIQKIKDLFTDASKHLQEATKGYYFREVSIFVPNTWYRVSPDENATEDLFSQAHFRVDVPSLKHGNEPYTIQPEGCGQPGLYTHWTPQYLRDQKSDSLARQNEKPALRLVQEWAHLRYGLFDEFGYPGNKLFPSVYFDKNNKLEGNKCTASVDGTIDVTCPDITNDAGIDLDAEVINCTYVPTAQTQDISTASILFSASIPEVGHFCDDSGPNTHNTKAPNKQNNMCNYKSAWAVLRDHKDFNNAQARRLMNMYSNSQQAAKRTTFKILRAPSVLDGRIVLVLDTSGSMKGRPMELLHAAASRAIQDYIAEGSQLGIVSFHTHPRTLANLTKVDKNSKARLIQLLPKFDDQGYTAIGKGLIQGIDVLAADGRSHGGRILLVTDGEENVAPRIDEVIPSLKSAGVQVVAIAFGVKATEKLERLVNATGGQIFLFADIKGKKPTAALDSAFLEGTTVQTTEELQQVRIVEETLNINQEWIERLLLVEDNLGKNLGITLTSPDIKNVQLTLVDPVGQGITQDSAEYDKDEVLQRIKITVPKAFNGTWRLSLRALGSGRANVALTGLSFPQGAQGITSPPRPLRIRAWVDNLQPQYPTAVRILAQVTNGVHFSEDRYDVVATVHRPGAKAVEVTLKDNGLVPDVTKGDGVYSGFFTHFTGNGRYAVLVRLREKVIKDTHSEGLSRYRRSVSEGVLERVADAGSFRLENWQDQDMIPPSRVTDLLTTLTGNRRDSILVSWTASGDDMNHGRASSIELRMSHDHDFLRNNFNSCELANDWFVDDVPMKLGGQMQRAKLNIPSRYINISDTITIFHFALHSSDNAGNIAELSNIASVALLPLLHPTTALPLQGEREILVPLVVGACVLLLLVAIAGLVLVVINKRKQHKTKTHYFGVPAEYSEKDNNC